MAYVCVNCVCVCVKRATFVLAAYLAARSAVINFVNIYLEFCAAAAVTVTVAVQTPDSFARKENINVWPLTMGPPTASSS